MKSAGEPSLFFEGLHYTKCGSGRPIIALHGFGMTSYSWRHLTAALSPKNQLFVFDLRGHGLSAKSDGSDYSLEGQARTVVRFIRSVPLKDVVLIGHSIGGAIALLSAIMTVEDRGLIRALILIDSVALPQRIPLFVEILRFPIVNMLLLRLIPSTWLVKFVLRRAYYNKSKITNDQIDNYASNLSTSAGIRALINMARQLVPPDITRLAEQFAEITIPTLLLWGQNDKIVLPAVGIAINALLSRSALTILDRCGHVPQEEVPERAIQAIGKFIEPS